MGSVAVGAVDGLRRYPVKSMLGEELTSCGVTERGLDGDRRLALIDPETGKVGSAKNPRLWRRTLKLAAVSGPGTGPVTISFPDGAVRGADDPDIDAALSEFLGRPVTLSAERPSGAELDRAVPEEVLRSGVEATVRSMILEIGAAAPAGTFFDFAPVHLLTTSTLDAIAGASPRGAVEAERYRPNLIIRTSSGPGFAENDWAGRELRIGDEVILQVEARSPRCAIPTLEHGDLPRDTDALRVPAARNRIRPADGLDPEPCAGVYARVIRPGQVRAGDQVSLH
ncbi:MAG: MOSC domain-containing protein [Streptosporangiales bacterium]|nr:MOSC domain-containing protein [Streptosporangiales bacterium]